MDRLTDYLARERETLRAATPRPWHCQATGHGGGPHRIVHVRDDGMSYQAIVNLSDPEHGLREADEVAIVSARNNAEALLDAVELLAELTRRVSTLLAKHEWDGWGPTSPNEIEEAYVGEFTSRARAVLSRLTADDLARIDAALSAEPASTD